MVLFTLASVARRAERRGAQALPSGAAALAASHLVLGASIRLVGVDGNLWWLTPGLAAAGAAIGMVMAPLVAAVLGGVDPARAGAASGVLPAAQQLGNPIGVAAIGIVYFGIAGTEASPPDTVDAMAACHLCLAGLAAVLGGLLGARSRTAPGATVHVSG